MLRKIYPMEGGVCVMVFNTCSHEVASVLNNMHQALNGINILHLDSSVTIETIKSSQFPSPLPKKKQWPSSHGV